jgi:DNA-binding transcriptional LysR family regulator
VALRTSTSIATVNLHQLRAFESVARNRSFTRAAAELSLTQPAVSVQIRGLEKSLGTELFERLGRDVGLTQAGNFLLEYARRILALLEEARGAIDDLQGLRRGRVSVATVSTPGAYVLPPLLGAFRGVYPGIRVTLEVTNRAVVRRRLLENEADLVIMGRPPDDVEYVARPFLDNDLVVVAAPGHPLARRRRIALATLAEEPLVMREPGSGTRHALEEHFQKHGVQPRVGLEVGDNSGVKEAVAEGLGISVLSRHALAMELALGRLAVLEVQGFPLRRQWYVVRSRSRRQSRAAEAFESFLLNRARDVLPRSTRRTPEPGRARRADSRVARPAGGRSGADRASLPRR